MLSIQHFCKNPIKIEEESLCGAMFKAEESFWLGVNDKCGSQMERCICRALGVHSKQILGWKWQTRFLFNESLRIVIIIIAGWSLPIKLCTGKRFWDENAKLGFCCLIKYNGEVGSKANTVLEFPLCLLLFLYLVALAKSDWLLT